MVLRHFVKQLIQTMKLRQLCMCILVLLFSLEEGSTLLRRFHARTSSLSKASPSDTLASLAIAIMTCPLLVTPQVSILSCLVEYHKN